MTLAVFVHDLANEGRVFVNPYLEESEYDLEHEFRELDRRLRAHAPAKAPALDIAAATWAAERLRFLCFFLKERKTEPADVEATLTAKAPFAATASTVWSVDIFFRCLCDVRRLTAQARLPDDDALVRGLVKLGRDWPLSATETADTDTLVQSIIDADPCLRRLQADHLRHIYKGP